MDTSHDIQTRLIDLEIRISFTDDLVDGLNRTIFRQQEQIDLLLREVSQLRRQTPGPGVDATANAVHELPPHY